MKVRYDNPLVDEFILVPEDFTRHGVTHDGVVFNAENDMTVDLSQEAFDKLKELNIPVVEVTEEDLEEDGDKPYTEWSKKELTDEIDARNEGRDEADVLRKSGTIAELAAILTSDDEASEA